MACQASAGRPAPRLRLAVAPVCAAAAPGFPLLTWLRLGLVLAQCGAEGRYVMGLRVDEVMCEEPKTCGSEEMAVDAMHVSGTRRRWAPAEALAVAPPARPASLGPVVHACPARVGPGWNAVCVL